MQQGMKARGAKRRMKRTNAIRPWVVRSSHLKKSVDGLDKQIRVGDISCKYIREGRIV